MRTLTPSFVRFLLLLLLLFIRSATKYCSLAEARRVSTYILYVRRPSASGCRPTLFSRFSFRFPQHIHRRPLHPFPRHIYTHKMHASTFVWTFLFLDVSVCLPASLAMYQRLLLDFTPGRWLTKWIQNRLSVRIREEKTDGNGCVRSARIVIIIIIITSVNTQPHLPTHDER